MSTTVVDLKRELHGLYSAKREPALVDVPDLPFLMIDGRGDPNTAPAYADAVQALYSVAYTIRFALKRRPDSRGRRPLAEPRRRSICLSGARRCA